LVITTIAIAHAARITADRPENELTWTKVVYLGGVPGVRVDRSDLEQTLTLTTSKLVVRVILPPSKDSITVTRRPPRVLLSIPVESLLAVTHSGFRHDMPTAQSWIGIPGKWPKATDHLLIIDYRLIDGREAEVLLRVDKGDYNEIVAEMQRVLRNRGTEGAPR
jgi:hypothetical protein